MLHIQSVKQSFVDWKLDTGNWKISPVTRRAAGQLFHARDLVFLDQPRAQAGIVRRALPGHVVDLLSRPNIIGGIPVAIQAPRHRQRRLLINQRHLVDAAVTGRAADTFADVDAVIEVHEVGQIVHARPVQRGVVAEARAHRFEDRRRRPDLRMTVHAGLRRRDVGERRLFHRGMTIAAVEPLTTDVMSMAELDRLLDEHVLVGVVSRQVDHADHAAKNGGESDDGKNAESGVDVRCGG